MRLYTVEVSYEMVVWAEDENNAASVACFYARDGFTDISAYDLDMSVRKYPEHGVPYGYDDDSGAYGSNKSIGELKNAG